MNHIEPDYGDDNHGEYKDSLLMGYIEPDGTQAEPNEPDFPPDWALGDFTAATDAWGEDPF